MKTSVLALGIFAALTTAYSHPRHLHLRRQNDTALVASATVAEDPLVTPPTVNRVAKNKGRPVVSQVSLVDDASAASLADAVATATPSGANSTVVAASDATATSTVADASSALPLAASATNNTLALAPSVTAAASGLTTLTVLATTVHTVTSCAATIRNCPTRAADISALPPSALAVVVVTDTLVLTETVCPVTDVASISSSVVQEASTRGLENFPTLTVTRTARVVETATVTRTSVAILTTPKAVTITLGGNGLGGGIPARIVTTTILSTFRSTVIQVVTVSPNQAAVPEVDTTTTRTSTRTGTRTVTVHDTATFPARPNQNVGTGNSPVRPNEEDCVNFAVTVTETVTVAAQTVTVAAPASTVFVTVAVNAGNTGRRNGNGNAINTGRGRKSTTAAVTSTRAAVVVSPSPTVDEVVTVEETETACAADVIVTITEGESAAPTAQSASSAKTKTRTRI